MTGHNPLFGDFAHPSDIRENYQKSIHNNPGVPSSFEKSRLIEKLRRELPVTFTRQYVCERLGGLISRKTLSNLDAMNKGPASKMNFGRRVSYDRDDFLRWLETRLEDK